MRRELANSDVPAYVNFCTRLDTVHYEHLKTFLLTFYGNAPEHLAKISAAKTLVEIQQVYLQLD